MQAAEGGAAAAAPARSAPRKRQGKGKAKRNKAPEEVEAEHAPLMQLPSAVVPMLVAMLDVADLCRMGRVNRAWRAESWRECHWAERATAERLDPYAYHEIDSATGERRPWPFIGLGPARLETLIAAVSKRRVVVALTSDKCTLCGEQTRFFSYLACARHCADCFRTQAGASLCSLSYAKAHFLLNAAQEAKLPLLVVPEARESGCVAKRTNSLPVTHVGLARAAAVTRFGSLAAFETEMNTRKARSEESFEKRHAAAREAKAAGGATKWPSRPRILGLGQERNWVETNQRGGHVRGPKYGHVVATTDRAVARDMLQMLLPMLGDTEPIPEDLAPPQMAIHFQFGIPGLALGLPLPMLLPLLGLTGAAGGGGGAVMFDSDDGYDSDLFDY